MTTIECCKCREIKKIEDFAKDSSRKNGHQRECKSCRKYRYHSNTDRDRDLAYKRLFGIDLIKYNAMFQQQEEKCLICKRHQSEVKNRFAVDHCHITGKVRA